MMRILFALSLLPVLAIAEDLARIATANYRPVADQVVRPVDDDREDRLWLYSAATLSTGTALDLASSWGAREGNGLLVRSSKERYVGHGTLAIKAGLTAGTLVAQRYVLREHPRFRRAFSVMNFALGAWLTGVAIDNMGSPTWRKMR